VEPIAKNQSDFNIEIVLEQYHNNTEEDLRLPWQKWIPFNDHLPLDNDDHIIVWNPKTKSFYDTRSFIALQHYLVSKYHKWPNEATYWMRISIP
jgi:hypothetical protein